jgi:hypothetical protein
VRRYLDPLAAGEYAKAYQEQCSALRDQETAAEYTARVSDQPRLTGYNIGTIETDPEAQANEMAMLVSVRLEYSSGPRDGQLRVALDPADKQYAVCGGDL